MQSDLAVQDRARALFGVAVPQMSYARERAPRLVRRRGHGKPALLLGWWCINGRRMFADIVTGTVCIPAADIEGDAA